MGAFINYPTLCSKENSDIFLKYGYFRIYRTLSQTPGFKNFVSAYRSSTRVINLGGRSERNKLDRRWSTELTIPPSSDARPLVYSTIPSHGKLAAADTCFSYIGR